MKPLALGAALIAFGVAGSLAVALTPEDHQTPVGMLVAVTLALALGGLWPVQRELTVAGGVIGLLFSGGMFFYFIYWAAQNHIGQSMFGESVVISLAILGGWTFVMMIGAGIGWLVQAISHRPRRGNRLGRPA